MALFWNNWANIWDICANIWRRKKALFWNNWDKIWNICFEIFRPAKNWNIWAIFCNHQSQTDVKTFVPIFVFEKSYKGYWGQMLKSLRYIGDKCDIVPIPNYDFGDTSTPSSQGLEWSATVSETVCLFHPTSIWESL